MVLRVRQLGKTFHLTGRELTVLHDVTLDVAPQETLAIVGPSGSGKSTFLGLAAGLDVPSAGTVELVGQALADLNEDGRALVRRDAVGFVFQSFQLVPTLTALENVMVPAELAGQGRKSRSRAEELLARVGLADRLTHYPKQLSGGEQQRVAIARAFINSPKVLFADEPTGNLDSATGAAVQDMLFALNMQHGTALILVTHDPVLAAKAERVVTFRNGTIVGS